MIDSNVKLVCLTVIAVTAIAGLVCVIIFFDGDVGKLLVDLVTMITALWAGLRVRQVTNDNVKTNEVIQLRTQAMAQAADSVNKEVKAATMMAAAAVGEAREATSRAEEAVEKADSVVEAVKRGNGG